jgi:hypothetical protein
MVLSTKRQWHGTIRKTERIRTHDFARWLNAVAVVRDKAEEGRDDVAAAICDAVEMSMFTGLRKSEIFELTLESGEYWRSLFLDRYHQERRSA